MHPDGSIHFEDLERLAKRQDEAGVGILLAGSTGEGLALSGGEKKKVVEFVAGLNLAVPIMVGVGGFNHTTQAKWIIHCNSLDIDAFLLVTPLYAKPGIKGQTTWFRHLMDISEKPCMLYNIPSRTGVKMSPEVLTSLKNHKNLWAVKEASGSVSDFKIFRITLPDLPLFSGDDALMPDFAIEGGRGLVSVASNIWPKATKLYVEKCLKGETESLFPVWPDAVKELFSAANPIPAKCLLKEKGLISHTTLRLPLIEDDLANTEKLLKADQQVNHWYKNNSE